MTLLVSYTTVSND